MHFSCKYNEENIKVTTEKILFQCSMVQIEYKIEHRTYQHM